jgi:hypothetical protein
VAFGGGFVVARIVGDGEAVVGRVGLDGVGDSGLGQDFFQELLLLVGERLVLYCPGHVDGGLDGGRLVVGAVGVVLLGDVPSVEGSGCRDRLAQIGRGDERQPAAHAVPGGPDTARLLLGHRVEVGDKGPGIAHGQVGRVALHHAHDPFRRLFVPERSAHVDRLVGTVAVVEVGYQHDVAQS